MKKWSLLILLALAQFIMVLDSTVMNVSISEVVADLNTSVSGLQAAITFYTLTMAALMLTGGKLGDKMGRLRAFKIGAVIYAIGSLITALSPNLGVLLFGWSLVEGLGAVLVIPAIAALLAATYKGKDRVFGFAVIGGVSGAAAAAGPLIGGFMTTYFSWRYVFVAETVIVAIILISARSMKATKPTTKVPPLDMRSVLLSVVGMVSLVFGLLQSKTWGWVEPMNKPEIAGNEIAPLGISLVAYLITIGIFVLYAFYRRQQALEAAHKNPLLQVSMLSSAQLRSGLGVLSSQYLITAAAFFVIPVYLQLVLGLNALDTGIRIFPLSVALILASMLGAKLASKYSPKQMVRAGQLLLAAGALLLVGAIDPELKSLLFAAGMFLLGGGLGLLASQLGNVNMSAVSEKQSSEAGGLQGTMQNLGSSFGTAVIGSVLIASLTTGFITNANANATIPPSVQAQIQQTSTTGVPIVSSQEVETYAQESGLPDDEAAAVAESYKASQIRGLKISMIFLMAIALFSIPLARNIPNKKMG
jgi:MFS family permease